MAIYRAIELVPSMHRGESEELYQTKVWLSFVISLAFAIGGILYTESISVFTSARWYTK